MRQALVMSYKAGQAQSTDRNSASVTYIQDRLSQDFSKYGSVERAPSVAQGSGTMTNMLMYPLDTEDLADPRHVPTMDIFINGQHFTFTTAKLVPKTVPVPRPPGADFSNMNWDQACNFGHGCPLFYQMIVNAAEKPSTDSGDSSDQARLEALDKKFCVADPCPGYRTLNVWQRFDLRRNGVTADHPSQYNDMAWQWRAVRAFGNFVFGNLSKDRPLYIDRENAVFPSFDVDSDGKEETIYGYDLDAFGTVTGVTVFDYQEGDLDMSGEAAANGQVGLLSDTSITTGPAFGTQKMNALSMRQHKGDDLVLSTSIKGQQDIIERKIKLSNNTGRMCDGSVPDVKTCVDCLGVNKNITCFDSGSNILYVRSVLVDKGGHFWNTDTSGQLNLGK